MQFNKRHASGGPAFAGSYQPGGAVLQNWKPSVGDNVTLHSAQVRVLAKITKVDGPTYEGEVTGFENYEHYEYQGSKPGDLIRFGYENVFGFSR